ncbi:ElyC/SanA/YdcF family protein [Gracilibacillus alcaliphilus]|uniref:ElyC/SanA/YdcF family protein n=1 Tax=Gracilibacillus alcaliphilus TaxID=1401441 RepID=UPI0019568E88|nr:ElyC/SanA/YdcF family protein [Gracilibacillus alcaliphilus]MBM7679123.1 tetratricopeptide (TPR) repeat protein [Gracilibacillus alcaliphilus]
MKTKFLTLLFSIFLIAGLAACENAENDTTEQTDLSGNTSTEETDAEEQDVDELFNQIRNNSPTSERIQALKDIAMHYYWYGGDLKEAEAEVFKGITLHGDYDVVEEAFKQAIAIEPHDMDLKFALASAQILQTEVSEALNTYEEIINYDEEYFNAWLMHGIYSKLEEDNETFETDFEQLKELDEIKAEEYADRITMVDEIKGVTLETEIPSDLNEENHAFVLLGYALSDDGEMEDTLLKRLEVAKEAAEAYPNSKIIVSGGVPKQGITEADVMFDWLVENGIEEERIIKEELATDTIENALFSMNIAKEEEIKDITVISSATHMRRALVIFNEVNNMLQKQGENIERDISNLVYMDFDNEEEAEKATKDEELVIYRDLIRASGIWQFPGMQR